MDRENFDKQLKMNIKQFNDIPLSVEQKIQGAYQKLDENKETEKKMKKFSLSRFIGIAASFIVVVFLAGNGIAYAMGNDNIYTWVLEKMGVLESYEEIANDVNITEESDEINITVNDIGYDENFLILDYKIQSSKLYDMMVGEADDAEEALEYIKNQFELHQIIRVNDTKIDKVLYCTDTADLSEKEDEDYEMAELYKFVEIVSKNEIVFYQLIDISDEKFGDKMNLDISIMEGITGSTDGPNTVFSGDWKFHIEDVKKGSTEFKKYKGEFAKASFKIKNEYGWGIDSRTGEKSEYTDEPLIIVNDKNNIGKITVDEVKISKVGSLIHVSINYKVGAVSAGEQPYYAMDIVDRNGDIVLEKQMVIRDNTYIARKLQLNEDYTLRVYKYYSEYWESFSEDNDFEQVATANFKVFED